MGVAVVPLLSAARWTVRLLTLAAGHTEVGVPVGLEVGARGGHRDDDGPVTGGGVKRVGRRAGVWSYSSLAGAPRAPRALPAGSVSSGFAEPGPLFAAFEVIAGWLVASRWWRAVWTAMVLVLTAGAVLFSRAHHDTTPEVALALAVAGTVPLAMLRRWPFTAIATVVAANGAFVIASRLPWPAPAVVCWLIALAAAPALLSRRGSALTVAVTEVAVVVGACMPESVNTRPWDTPITEAVVVLMVWTVATMFRLRRESGAERLEVIAEIAELRVRDAAAHARAGIARDLHDVVAHHVSLIAVRAGTAPYQFDGLSAVAGEAFEEIAAQARMALDELRAVLGVLRGPDSEAMHAPQPGLADIPELLERMRASGLTIELRTRGTPGDAVPVAVQLCCYRVLQEALTNVTRHAPRSPADIDLSYGSHITMLITNPLGEQQRRTDPSPGFGLMGMRERITAVGGDYDAGAAGIQFHVRVRIPTTPAGRTSARSDEG